MNAQSIKSLIPAALASGTTTPERPVSNWRPVLDSYEPSLRAAADACAQMVYDMELGREPYWMTLTGMNGCGKTMLMSQVYEQSLHINPGNPWNNPIWPPDYATNGAHRYEGGRPYCRFVDEQSLARRMRAGEFTLPASYREDYFVAFDELGVARDPTNFIADAVSTFCDGRLRGWGMFTTNLTLAEIADRMDPRIASRLIRDGNQVVIIKAGDYALRPAATLSKATVKLDEGDRQTFA